MKPNLMSAKDRRGLRAPFALVLALAALLAMPIAASALHWPNFGGDAGHSGNQPVRPAQMGIEFLHRQTDSGTIRTSLVTSGGDAATGQRVSYGKFINVSGTSNDQTRIHIRDLATGAEKVPDGEQVIDDDNDGEGDTAYSDDVALGFGNRFVTPVSSSSDGGLGQLYVVHNDEDSSAATGNGCTPSSTTGSDNDIAIAQFDEATGAQKKDVAVGQAQGRSVAGESDPTCPLRDQPTDGFQIESSPVLTPPLDGTGRRLLFFVARNLEGGSNRLFQLEINNAGSPDAVIESGSVRYRDIPGLNTLASPAIAFLRQPGGFVLPYVVVAINAAAGSSDVRAYVADTVNFSSAPNLEVPNDIPGDPQAISIPSTEDGQLPSPNTNDEKAPAIYVTYKDGDSTRVHKFVQEGSDAVLTDTVPNPPALDGEPGPGMALSMVVSGGTESDGNVIVTTGKNLFVLDKTTLAPVEALRDSGETLFEPGSTGFGRNAPLTSGGFIFVQDDRGVPYVLDVATAERVAERDFTPQAPHLDSSFGIGQPSYSNGYSQWLTDRGLFVYETGIFFPPNQKPVARFSVSPNPATVNQPVTFDASESVDPDGKSLTYEWDFDGDGTFEVNRGNDPVITVSFPVPRTYDVSLRVTDEALERTAAQSDTTTTPVVVNPGPQPPPNVPPTATFTTTPNPTSTGRQVTFDASGSRDSDGSIVRYEWDLDGNGSFETNTGSNPRAQRSYSTPAVYNVKVRVTDNAGAATEATRQLTVTGSSTAKRKRPRSLSATTKPSRDRRLPYVFKTSGRLRPAKGVRRADACAGRVTVTFKAGKKTISRRTTKLRKTCTYRSSVTFRDSSRVENSKRLRIVVRFQGNKFLTPKSARTRSVRIG